MNKFQKKWKVVQKISDRFKDELIEHIIKTVGDDFVDLKTHSFSYFFGVDNKYVCLSTLNPDIIKSLILKSCGIPDLLAIIDRLEEIYGHSKEESVL